jgi:nicotinate-nucleotide pyrophosphorylase (carboxylating)
MHQELDSHEHRLVAFLQTVDMSEVGAFLEVEVRTEKEAMMAAMVWSGRKADGVDRLVIMLDNFTPDACKSVSEQMIEQEIRQHVVLEASGGITFEGLDEWRECGLDVVSTSAINRGVKPMDLSMLAQGL